MWIKGILTEVVKKTMV